MGRASRRQQLTETYLPVRFWSLVGILLLLALLLVERVIHLAVSKRPFLVEQGNARTMRLLSLPAYRGMITDRMMEPLAVSSPVESVWVNPAEFLPSFSQLRTLASTLHVEFDTLRAHLSNNATKQFVYLRRHLDPEWAASVRALHIPGVYFEQGFRRFYPEGEVMAHVVGMTNVDDHGQEGMELAYHQWLQGVPGKKRVIQDRLGHVVADLGVVSEPRPGRHLVLSIDRRVQYVVYQELMRTVQQYQAESATMVILDVQSGEVLAMVNYPSFNPNDREHMVRTANDQRFRNRALTDVFEPGSTLKTLSMAAVLNSGLFSPRSVVDTHPGWMAVGKHRIQEPQQHDYGVLDLSGVLEHSSNVGISKLVFALPSDAVWRMLDRFGLGKATDVGFPGEVSGVLPRRARWSPFMLATLSFGYGVSTTAMQLAQAYASIAAHGIHRPVSLLKREGVPHGYRVLPAVFADQLLVMLQATVERGNAGEAAIPGYTVGGKTGTARLLGKKGYLADKHASLFVGMVPAREPRLVAVVFVKDPKGRAYYGGQVAAPVFSKVMSHVLRMMAIPPDAMGKSA